MSCDTKFCRSPAEIRYLGVPLCVKHWTELAEANLRDEERILAEHGLRRVSGAVQTIPKEPDHDERLPVAQSASDDRPPG